METLSWMVVLSLGVLAIPSLANLLIEGAWRSRWRIEDTRDEDLRVDGQGAFREAPVRATVGVIGRDRAPLGLRAMAFSCWLLAQMVIPGFLAWCVGWLMIGEMQRDHDPVGLVLMVAFMPGAACAWMLWRAGSSLVRGEAERADRDTAHAAVVIGGYNALSLVAALGWYARHPRAEVLVACAAYSALSIVHVLAVRAAFLAHRAAYPIVGAAVEDRSVTAHRPQRLDVLEGEQAKHDGQEELTR